MILYGLSLCALELVMLFPEIRFLGYSGPRNGD